MSTASHIMVGFLAHCSTFFTRLLHIQVICNWRWSISNHCWNQNLLYASILLSFTIIALIWSCMTFYYSTHMAMHDFLSLLKFCVLDHWFVRFEILIDNMLFLWNSFSPFLAGCWLSIWFFSIWGSWLASLWGTIHTGKIQKAFTCACKD